MDSHLNTPLQLFLLFTLIGKKLDTLLLLKFRRGRLATHWHAEHIIFHVFVTRRKMQDKPESRETRQPCRHELHCYCKTLFFFLNTTRSVCFSGSSRIALVVTCVQLLFTSWCAHAFSLRFCSIGCPFSIWNCMMLLQGKSLYLNKVP